MKVEDLTGFAARALTANRLRSALILLAVAIGVSAVVLLSALGDSARRYVTDRFTALGTHLLIILPGRSETTGGPPPLFGETPRDLTLDDALALTRSPRITRVAPVTAGAAPVTFRGREREVNVLGTTAEFQEVRHISVAQGRFLPAGDPRRAAPVCVLGNTVKNELFGPEPALGQWVRIGDRRFRVIGVLTGGGHSIGLDLDDLVVIPVASAQMLFDAPSLFRVLASARSGEELEAAAEDVRAIIRARHDGEDDVTVITQDAVVGTFDRILRALTLTVAGIAAVSLGVAGILIMNVMLVSVSQRTAEIGLLKALGAPPRQIQRLFLAEAALLSLAGAALGVAGGYGGAWLLGELYPALPMAVPLWAVGASLGVALATGLLFGVLPARRAARLDPVLALSRR